MTMRKHGVVLPELFAQGMKRFFWLPIARDKSECPISDLLFAGVPFVGPGKENGASESTFDHAIDMPARAFRPAHPGCVGLCPFRIRPG